MTSLIKDGVLRTPTGLKVKGQSYLKLEAAADNLRPHLPKVKGMPFSLDCLSIFEGTLPSAGYNYRSMEIDEMGDVVGLTMTTAAGNIVALREDIYDKLHSGQVFGRSTVVHELSHIALDHHVTWHRGHVGDHGFFEDSEWQAKSLTAALMMPLEACRAARSASELANMCGTSVEAARYRINTLVTKMKLLSESHVLWSQLA